MKGFRHGNKLIARDDKSQNSCCSPPVGELANLQKLALVHSPDSLFYFGGFKCYGNIERRRCDMYEGQKTLSKFMLSSTGIEPGTIHVTVQRAIIGNQRGSNLN